MPTHSVTLAVFLVTFSAVISLLGPKVRWRSYVLRARVTTALLCSLMGMGAVFGKVLGDFLRAVE